MKKGMLLVLACIIAFCCLGGCSKVPAGHVGVKVYLLGGSKGVDTEELSPGRYWIGWNEELHLFPTFAQNYVWTASKTEQSPVNESITFQSMEGMDINTDIGITYSVDPKKVPLLFQKYRKGINEITAVYLRNMVRDAFITLAASRPIEIIYGEGKSKLVKDAENMVREQVAPIGIKIERVYLVGALRLPRNVVAAINAKIEATQKAQQRRNEVEQAKAEAQKKIEGANGEAKSLLAVAKAQAEANRILSESLTPELVRYKSIEKWNGELPRLTGNAVPFIQFDKEK